MRSAIGLLVLHAAVPRIPTRRDTSEGPWFVRCACGAESCGRHRSNRHNARQRVRRILRGYGWTFTVDGEARCPECSRLRGDA